MTPQEIVRARYPHAESQHHNHLLNQGEPIQPEEWGIYASNGLGTAVLAKGRSEEEAWAHAAAFVQARSRKKLPGFKQWLAQEAQRERAAMQQTKLIEDWTAAVAALFAQLMRWLAEEDTEKQFQVETGKLHKDEQGLGSYAIGVMRLCLSSRCVDLIPIGRNVVGGIGEFGDLGFRSEGRVDMTNGVDKYMLYRVVTPEGKEWMIVDDVRYEVRPLTKAAFEEALQDLLS